MNKKLKLGLIWSTVGVVTTSAIIVPIACTYKKQQYKYSFGDGIYDNYDDLMKYVDSNTTKKEIMSKTDRKWSMDNNGIQTFYDNSTSLTNDAMNNIKVYDAYTSLKYNEIASSKGALNEISQKTISQMDLKSVGSSESPDTVTVYQGKNDSIFTDKNKAKKTFYSIHNGYYFNNIYFRSLTDLRQYLQFQDNAIPLNNQLFTLKNPNNSLQTSLPIDWSKLQNLSFNDSKYLNDEEFIKVKNFVKNYSNKYISVEDKNSETDKTTFRYFDINKNNTASLIAPYFDISKSNNYTKVYSNKNIPTYILDVDKDDEHNLIGSYFYSGGGNILSSNDKSNWYKVEKAEFSDASKTNELVSQFFDVLLNESKDIPKNSIFNREDMFFYFYEIKDSYGELSGYSLNYQWKNIMDLVSSNYPKLYKRFITTFNDIQRTKRYNAFYKMPILFTLLIEGLMNELAPNEHINMVRNFFNNLCLKMDKTINIINNSLKTTGENFDILENSKSSKTKFSFVDYFGFNNPNYDLGQNIESLLNNIPEYYPNLLIFILISQLSISNNMAGIPYFEPYLDTLKQNFNKFGGRVEEGVFDSIKSFNKIYSYFLSDNVDELYELLKDGNENLAIEDVYELLSMNVINNSIVNNLCNDSIKKQLELEKNMILDNLYDSSILGLFNKKLYDLALNQKYIKFVDLSKLYVMDKIISLYNINLKMVNIENTINDTFNTILKLSNIHTSKLVNLFFQCTKFLGKLSVNIYSKAMANLAYQRDYVFPTFSKIFEPFEKISNLFDKLESVIDSYEGVFDDIFNSIDFSVASKIFESVSNFLDNPIFKTLQLGLSAVGFIGAAFSVLQLVLDLFLPKTEYYSFEFSTSKGEKIQWDGGQKTTMFMGAITLNETKIDDMKYISPILLQDAHSESYYYSNGKKYYELDALKNDSLNNFVENDSNMLLANNIKKVYGFNNPISSEDNESNLIGDDENELAKNIILDLKKQSNIQNSIFYNSTTYKYSNGFSSDLDAVIKDKTEEIISDIRPTKIAMLPNIDEKTQFPVFDKNKYESTGNDGSTNSFKLPGRVWDAELSKEVYDPTASKYSYKIVNPNALVNIKNDDNSNSNIMNDNEAYETLTNMVLNSFEVESKVVTKQDYINKTKFSELTSTYSKYNVYQVNDPIRGSYYFLNEVDALNYYFQINNMRMHELTPIKYNYIFNGITFSSKDELYNYIKNNTIEMRV